ncbi:DUF1819 family protein [Pseudomonadota bacterium]
MISPSTAIKYRLSFTTGGLFWSESIDLIDRYLHEGDWDSLRTAVVSEDALHLRTRAASMRISREIISRLKELSEKELSFFNDASTQEQLWMLWVAVCRHYSFIREFAVEVLRENYITLRHKVDHKDFDAFFHLKAQVSDEVESLKESTRRKLRQNLFRMLREADLITESFLITPPILTAQFIELISEAGMTELDIFPVSQIDLQQWRK